MAVPAPERQKNRQIVIVNMAAVIDDIRTSYPHETFGNIADKVGVAIGTVKTWYRTGRARKKVVDALISAYPIPPPAILNTGSRINGGEGIGQVVPLSELFDHVIQGLSEIRERLGV
jgi:predicted DNA-binding protein (UPF0251 family)